MVKKEVLIESTPRIQVLDQLRGFALLLIFIVNLPELSGMTFGGIPTSVPLADETLSSQLHDWVRLLFGNSARPLFAFMFGISMMLIYDSVKSRGKNPFFTLTRRMVVLMVIGYIHFVYIWFGDILLMYSLDGLMLLLFVAMSAWPLFLFALLSILLFSEMDSGIFMNLYNNDFPLSSSLIIIMKDKFRDYLWLGSNASFESNDVISGFLYQMHFALPHFFFFLVGMLAYHLNLFHLISRKKWLSWIIAIVLLVGGIYGKHMLLGIHSTALLNSNSSLINFAVSLGIAFVIILLGSSTRLSLLTKPFTAAGRMAFTNYLVQSLVFVSIFIPAGQSIFKNHGLLEPLPYSILLPIGLVFFGLQMWASTIWLRHFYYGPFEWLWRWGTNLKLPPMRRKAVPKESMIEDRSTEIDPT